MMSSESRFASRIKSGTGFFGIMFLVDPVPPDRERPRVQE
jgi:hypothetical protein